LKLSYFIVHFGTVVIVITFVISLFFLRKEKPRYYNYIFFYIISGLLISANTIANNNNSWLLNKKIPILTEQLLLLFQVLLLGLFFIEGEGLLFFTLGIAIQKSSFDIDNAPRWLGVKIWAPIFIFSAVVKTWLAFQFGWDFTSFIFLSLLHKICIFSGLVTVWYGCNTLVAFFMNRKWFTWLSAFAFIIYALHVPLVNYCTRIVFTYFSGLPNLRLLTFVVLPLLIIACCVFVGAIFRSVFPKVYALATGGRGLGWKDFSLQSKGDYSKILSLA